MTRSRRGFTLLEVMVAVAILALTLTAFFASQSQAIRTAQRARTTSVATVMARCKMGEIEEQLMRDGFPAVSASDTDECCEDAELEGFECDWKVDRVVLPDAVDTGEEGEGEGAAGGAPGGGAAAGVTAALGGDGTPQGAVESLVSGGASGDAMASLALEYAYPIMKPSIEEQVRRVEITVRWKEGTRDRTLQVVRYVVADQPPPPPEEPPP